MSVSESWELGSRGKDAAYIVETGEIHTALHVPGDGKFWNLYVSKSNKLVVGTVYGIAGGRIYKVNGSVHNVAFDDEDQRDLWIEKTIAKKKKDGYESMDTKNAWIITNAEEPPGHAMG